MFRKRFVFAPREYNMIAIYLQYAVQAHMKSSLYDMPLFLGQDQDPQSFRNKPGKEKNYHTCGQVQEIESSPGVGNIPAWLRNDGARHRSGS